MDELDALQKLGMIKEEVEQWIHKQGHDRCWFYPDIFMKLCEILEIKPTKLPCLPPLEEFKVGCEQYQREEYGR